MYTNTQQTTSSCRNICSIVHSRANYSTELARFTRTLPTSFCSVLKCAHVANSKNHILAKAVQLPGVLQTARLLAPRSLNVEASLRAVVRAPHRPTFLLPCLSINRLPITSVLSAVSIKDVDHMLQAVSCAIPVLLILYIMA